MRKDYRIKPKVIFEIDNRSKIFCILPTIIFQPWKYRYIGGVVVDITWLNLHIGIGIWENK